MYYYSKETGEHIDTDTPASWMGKTNVPVPAYDKATSSAIFYGSGWEVVFPTIDPAEIEQSKVAVVQEYMDEQAQAMRYDSIQTAVTYAEEPGVPKFQVEGIAFRAWRSLVWETCYQILAEVTAGTRQIPSDEELVALLPTLVFDPVP